MKWSIDEKTKHRIVGLAVILSVLGAVLPFIVGKNDILMDEGIKVSVEMPRKPLMPTVTPPEEAEVFQTEDVAHVELPAVPVIKNTVLPSKVVTAPKPLPVKPVIKPLAKKIIAKPIVKPIAKPIAKPIVKHMVKPVLKTPVVAAKVVHRYTIQLANLSQKANAEVLVKKLKAKGFSHVMIIPYTTASKGLNYKVRVGFESDRNKIQDIQKRVQAAVNMKGIIVQGVS